MPIVSISLTKDFLKEMDELQSSEGFSGRSELIRAGIRSLINQKADRENLVGAMQCILLITHEEGEEHSVTDIKHEFDKITKNDNKTFCVIGRPIYQSENYLENLKNIIKK